MSDYRIPEQKKLYRSRRDRVFFGVCGGIAEYFGIDSGLVRVATVLFVFLAGSGFLAYLIIGLILRENPNQ